MTVALVGATGAGRMPGSISLLITGVASAADPRVIRTVGLRAFGTFLGLLSLSAVFALLVIPSLFTWLRIDPATSAALRRSAS